jgi:hypothetical protein
MPAYTKLRTFVNALKSGQTHITDSLDAFFQNPAAVMADANWAAFSSGDWLGGTPSWLPAALSSIGLTGQEVEHVLKWPLAELEKTRVAARDAVNAGEAIKFFWVLYNGASPVSVPSNPPTGRQVLFQSPGASLRLTSVNYGEIYVEEV